MADRTAPVSPSADSKGFWSASSLAKRRNGDWDSEFCNLGRSRIEEDVLIERDLEMREAEGEATARNTARLIENLECGH